MPTETPPVRTDPAAGGLLLVDPQAPRRALLAEWLAGAGFECLQADRPAAATEVLRGQSIGVALIEADMVAPNRRETLDVLRRAGQGYLPVLVYGASLDGERRACLLEDGADEAMELARPTAELAARIRGLLGQKALRDGLTQCRSEFHRALGRQHRLVRHIRKHNRRLRDLTLTDPLTGVHNLRFFRQWLFTQFEIARRYELVMSVLMVDIDNFKRINDTCGHPFGDYVLTHFAQILKQHVRSSDVVARVGGDEFVIGLVETSRQEAIRFGRRLLRTIAGNSFEYFGRTESITASIGQACYPEDVQVTAAEQLLLFADQALYRAKAQGRNDLACWHELDPAVRLRLARPTRQPSAPTVSGEPTLCLFDPDSVNL